MTKLFSLFTFQQHFGAISQSTTPSYTCRAEPLNFCAHNIGMIQSIGGSSRTQTLPFHIIRNKQPFVRVAQTLLVTFHLFEDVALKKNRISSSYQSHRFQTSKLEFWWVKVYLGYIVIWNIFTYRLYIHLHSYSIFILLAKWGHFGWSSQLQRFARVFKVGVRTGFRSEPGSAG